MKYSINHKINSINITLFLENTKINWEINYLDELLDCDIDNMNLYRNSCNSNWQCCIHNDIFNIHFMAYESSSSIDLNIPINEAQELINDIRQCFSEYNTFINFMNLLSSGEIATASEILQNNDFKFIGGNLFYVLKHVSTYNSDVATIYDYFGTRCIIGQGNQNDIDYDFIDEFF